METICVSGVTEGSQQLDVLEADHKNASHSLLSFAEVEEIAVINCPRGQNTAPPFGLLMDCCRPVLAQSGALEHLQRGVCCVPQSHLILGEKGE